MKIEMRVIDQLSPDHNNARQHDPRNLKAIKESLDKFGQQKPIVINRDAVILAGNGTWTAAKQLGWQEIAVVVTELKEHAATAFAIADNRSAELAEWDEEVLAESLISLQSDSEIWLESCGFEKAELDAMLEAMGEWPETEPEPIAPLFQALVECNDEEEQQAVYAWLKQGGYSCKLLNF